ncbi:MAG: PAS domain S-box protein [Candidatus Bathyarchaeota archaeon]|nr:PAS domain S-box protein [Candidatus Bathyarchaeota archaeon]
MHVTEDGIKALVSLGLSGTQAKICLILAQLGSCTISEIAQVSGIARPDTYRVVLELEAKGIVEKILSTPTKYELLPLPKVVSLLMEHREAENREIKEATQHLIREYDKYLTDKQPLDSSQLILVPDGVAFSNRLGKLIQKAKQSICIISNQKTLTQFIDLIAEKNLNKEVQIKVVVEKSKPNSLSKQMLELQKNSLIECRGINILPPFSLLTFDQKESLLLTNMQTEDNKAHAVYSNNPSFVELSQSYFNEAWSAAIEPTALSFKRTKTQFDQLFKHMLNGFCYSKIVFQNGELTDLVILQVNEAYEKIMGLKRETVIGKRVTKAIPNIEGINPEFLKVYSRVARTGKAEDFEGFFKSRNRWLHVSVYTPRKGYLAMLYEDISDRKKYEAEQQLMIEFLKFANQTSDTQELIRLTVDFFQKQSGCDAVGIRLKQGEDYPYYETRGFPPEHILLENHLCTRDEAGCLVRDTKGDPILECMCGNVICGRFDPTKGFFTKKGSFWTNGTSELLSSTTDKDRQTRTRNRCNGEGYESVALIALRVGSNRLGLLQLNDKRRGMFTLEKIEMWERIADSLALGLSKTIAEESLIAKQCKPLNSAKSSGLTEVI